MANQVESQVRSHPRRLVVSLVTSLLDNQPERQRGTPVASRVYSPVACLQETRVESHLRRLVASLQDNQLECHL